MSLIEKRQEAIILRKRGYSYSRILKKLGMTSKGTLSHWFKDIVLPEKTQKKLKNDYKINTVKALAKFNKNRSKIILKENRQALLKGKKDIKIMDRNHLLILGSALYWGEGTKYVGRSPSLIFTNSDPDMIKVYMKFLRRGLLIKEMDIKAGIHIHPYVDVKKSREFWSKVTGLARDVFYIVNVTSSASRNKRPSRKLPYGMAVIKVNRRKVFYTVMGMIEVLKIR